MGNCRRKCREQLPVLIIQGKKGNEGNLPSACLLYLQRWAAIGIRRTHVYEGLHQAAFEGACVRKTASTAFVDIRCGGFEMCFPQRRRYKISYAYLVGMKRNV